MRERTASVEYRAQQDVEPTLADIASALASFGYRVTRWTHSDVEPGKGPIDPEPCDLAVAWHGMHILQESGLAKLRRCGAKVLFLEYAWWDRGLSFQADPRGTNGAASWARWPEEWHGTDRGLKVSPGPLLACLQGEYDAASRRISPHFAKNCDFVTFLARYSRLPVVVRPHPETQCDRWTRAAIREAGVEVDDASRPIEEAVERASAVATLSSACGVTAMEMGKPVLVYGTAAYRRPGAVYCLDNRPIGTLAATEAIRRGTCELSADLIADTLATLRKHTLYRRDLPGCLRPILEAIRAA